MFTRLIIGITTVVLVQTLGAVMGFPGNRDGNQDRKPQAIPPAPAFSHTIKMRVVECKVGADGKATETVLSTPTILTGDGQTASIFVGDQKTYTSIQVTPRRKSAQAVEIRAEIRYSRRAMAPESTIDRVLYSGQRRCTVIPGRMERITGMTANTDKSIRRAVQQGKIAPSTGEYTATYLDLTDAVSDAQADHK